MNEQYTYRIEYHVPYGEPKNLIAQFISTCGCNFDRGFRLFAAEMLLGKFNLKMIGREATGVCAAKDWLQEHNWHCEKEEYK